MATSDDRPRDAASGTEWTDRLEQEVVRRWGAFLAGRSYRVLVFVVALLLTCFLSYKAVDNQLTETNLLHEDRVSLARYLAGTAFRPFAYRLLTPLLVEFAQNVLHIPDLVRMLGPFVQQKTALLCAGATSDPRPSCDNIVAYMSVAYGFVFCFLITMYCMAVRLFGRPMSGLLAVGLSYAAVNAVILLKLSHVYDFGGLLFVALLLLTLEYRKYLLYTVILAIAYANKETAILYSGVFFAVNFGRLPLRRNLIYFGAQLLLFLVIHGSIRQYFSHNEGFGHEYYLPLQISFFTEHVTLSILLFMLFSIVLFFYRFGEKNHTIRRACIVIYPWFVLFMIGGVEREVRVTFEIFPLLLLLAQDSLHRLILGDTPGKLAV